MPRSKNPNWTTNRQRRFVDEYLVDLNATQAALRAGYGAKKAWLMGHNNLKHPIVGPLIEEAMRARSVATGITAEVVLRELLYMARLDPLAIFNEDGTMRPIAQIPEEARRAIAAFDASQVDGGDENAPLVITRKIRFHDKTRALELLGKHLRLWADRLETTGPNGAPIIVELVNFQ